VLRRVHRQQHHAHHLERVGVEVLEHDAALARREQVRLTCDLHDIGVAQHCPEAGLAVHLLPRHRCGGTQFGQQVVGNAIGEEVWISE
jgi:hypothetical protein